MDGFGKIEHLMMMRSHDDERIDEMNEVWKQIHVVEKGLGHKRGIPIEIDQAGYLCGQPHAQVQTGYGPQLQNHLLVAAPFESLHFHRSLLQQNAQVDEKTKQRYDDQRSVVVDVEIEIVPLSAREIARVPTEQFSVVVLDVTSPNEDGNEVEDRWVRQTEQQRHVVKENLAA